MNDQLGLSCNLKNYQQSVDELSALADKMGSIHLSNLFAQDKQRFAQFKFEYLDLITDFSKQRINQEILQSLFSLAKSSHLEQWINTLFSDAKLNSTENRQAKHWALRLPENNDVCSDLVHQQLEKMAGIVDSLLQGQYRGITGEVITDVVNIGVGGSDLGPLMASTALSDYKVSTPQNLTIHFASTMDGSQLSSILHELIPERTLFIISSKSFTTIDTLSNAQTALSWLYNYLGDSETVKKCHFVGVSSAKDKMTEWGIAEDNQLMLWDWVGGRYSLWSCIGFPIALTIGMKGFYQFLQGAYDLDQHFRQEQWQQNIPVLLALIGIWNNNFLNIKTHAILPYDGRLKFFHAYLQQLEMESNGKSINRAGEKVAMETCPVIWGEVGPNAQHAFYQLLHQGTHDVSCDFIAPIQRYHENQKSYLENAEELKSQHQLALANCLAQSRLLAFGSDTKEANYMQYEGNQPNTTILLKELSPHSLGMLIACYEHKVFVQSVIWGINPFDQWGVEKGKAIANELLPSINGNHSSQLDLDESTLGLLALLRK